MAVRGCRSMPSAERLASFIGARAAGAGTKARPPASDTGTDRKAALRRVLFSIVTRNIVTFRVILTLVVVPLVYRYLGDVEDLMSDTVSVQLAGVAELGRFLLNAEEVDQVRNLIWYEACSEEERRTLAGGIDQVRQLLIEGKKTFLELVGEEDSGPNYTIAESKIDRIAEELLTTVNAQTAEAIRPVLARLKRVPTGRLVRKYKTLVESTAERLGKQARFELHDKDGTEVPVDYFQKLDPTFLHIIRNAIDHGIEDVEQRLEAGKEPLATIALTTEYRDGGVIFSISDDGRGIDTEQIRAIGLERGFIKPGQAKGMSRQDVLRLLFLPAFSSRDSVSELSGRGVGLDVVRTDVERMQGRMRLVTRKGRGTTFHLYYPLPV